MGEVQTQTLEKELQLFGDIGTNNLPTNLRITPWGFIYFPI